ncbi:MAG: PD-(D/E)XK nuclease family protein [Actinobacteria bacterium]|nr:PD-(D/E)XK nuclease family protein [Actinomycetota bacterium]
MAEPLGELVEPLAEAQLTAAVAEAKRHDPLAPVTVVVPSNYAALSLRRRLGRRNGGLVNVQFLNLARVAELLGAPALAAAGRRPLTKAVRTEAIRAALAEDAGAFASVAAHPSTLDALDRTFADLRLCPVAQLESVAAMSRRAAEVVRLFRATRARLADRYYDEHDLAEAATAAGTAAELGRVIVVTPRRLAPSMQRMIESLGALVIERDTAVAPEVHRVISALDPDDEMRAAVRVVMQEARRGTALHRIALLWPADEPYAVLADQQLRAAGVPHNGPATRTLAHTVTGTALTQLLALPDRRFRRDEVMAWLASAPILEDANRAGTVPASQWDVVSGAAGVIEGAEQWHGRLTSFAAAEVERKNALAQEGDADQARLDRIDTNIERAARLRVFAVDLIASLDATGRTTWTGFSEWACGLLDRYLGREERHYRWPDAEQGAWRAVREALEQLSVLDDVAGAPATVDLTRFRQAVTAELATPAGRHGRFGTGVFTAHLGAALATDFDVVVVTGLVEGTLPSRRSEDVLLPDAERTAAAGQVRLRGDKHDDELADLRSALAAGNRLRVLTWPRTDPRRRRERLPSRWLPTNVAEERIESFQHGVMTAEPASLFDYDLRGLLDWTEHGGKAIDHILAAELPTFAAGLVAAEFRSSTAFTSYDGHVGAGYIDPLDAAAPMSPTSLEAYAVCPARYFYSKVLNLGPPEKPEEIRRIAPMTKGSLVHEVLERFIVDALAHPSTRREAHLLELAEAAFDDYHARGLTGVPLLWQYERELMRRELTRFFAEDDDGSEPLAAELTFGRHGEQPVVLTLPGGGQIGFRGTADRVDRTPEGTIRVTDYKTGSDKKYEALADDPVARGQLLQLPLYGLAARARFGDETTPIESRYWMVSERSGFRRHSVAVDDATVARLHDVLDVLVAGIAAGRFPARPGEEDWRGGWDHCRFCDFDRVCPADRDRAWERVQATPELEAYLALAEGEPA